MVSVGIDVSKGKSMVCIMRPYGEMIRSPYEVQHTEQELKLLSDRIQALPESDVRIVLEATGIYHLPIVFYLQQHGIFVSVINPLSMKKYASISIRQGKTDKIDSVKIANYGIDNWFHLTNFQAESELYTELRLLGRQYLNYISLKIKAKVNLTHLLDKTMPGAKPLLRSQSAYSNQEKLCAVAYRY